MLEAPKPQKQPAAAEKQPLSLPFKLPSLEKTQVPSFGTKPELAVPQPAAPPSPAPSPAAKVGYSVDFKSFVLNVAEPSIFLWPNSLHEQLLAICGWEYAMLDLM